MQCDVVVRAEGTIEFWIKEYNERRPLEQNCTHHSFALVLELGIRENDEDGTDEFNDVYW
jgi:hypothetical protein